MMSNHSLLTFSDWRCARHLFQQRTETPLSSATERVSGPPRSDPDQVSIQLDWEVPPHARAPVRISGPRQPRRPREFYNGSLSISHRLQAVDLQILHDLLAYPPRGYWLARAVAWLIDTSLRQGQPHLSLPARRAEVRHLLLVR
jgi:hypothetical protein